MTYCNVLKLTDHEGIACDLDTRIYFVHSYGSWERGLSENNNGFIRQCFPKHPDLTTANNTEIEQAANKLKHRPKNY